MADELINLVEYAKGMSNPLSGGMIEQFAASSDVLETISFKGAKQGLNVFDRETSEPSVAFRALNSEPEISYGTQERFQDHCQPISGLIENDRIKRLRYGDGQQVTYMKGQMKNAARLWTNTFIHGDNASDPVEWNGLQKRLVADESGSVDGTVSDSRLIANSQAAGGGPLQLSILDRALEMVTEPTHWIMPRIMKARLSSAGRDPNLSTARVTEDYESDLGRRVMRFAGIPILSGYEPSQNDKFLPFDEVGFGGGAAQTSSIYLVSFREDGVCGIQTKEPDFVPVDTDRGVFERNLFEWDNGITIEDFYSALRISSITDASVIA